MIPVEKVREYLDRIDRVAAEGTLSDMHVHPFEVMSSDIQYQREAGSRGVFNAGNFSYTPPMIGPLPDSTGSIDSDPSGKQDLIKKMVLLHARRLYAHTGPVVMGDHMAISGVSRMLLLPVAANDDSRFGQMELMMKMFGNDERFSFGFSVPNHVPNQEIGRVVGEAVHRYGIIALKIHPNISGMDLTTASGVERLEYLLQASKEQGLSVIVHGGLSPDLFKKELIGLGTLDNLSNVDWNLTDQTVVIAHAGSFGYSNERVKRGVLPKMELLLSKYNHMVVDTSGISLEIMKSVVSRIDIDRILFGSDALYFPTWVTLVRLMVSLENESSTPDEDFYGVVSVNVNRYIFSD